MLMNEIANFQTPNHKPALQLAKELFNKQLIARKIYL
jgi:hypothetical protein